MGNRNQNGPNNGCTSAALRGLPLKNNCLPSAEELAARKCALACLLTFEQSPTSQIFTPKLRGELPFVQKSKPFVPGTFPAFCGLRYPRP